MRNVLIGCLGVGLLGLATFGCGETPPEGDDSGAGGTASGGTASATGGGGSASSGGAASGGGATVERPDLEASVLVLPFGGETFLLVNSGLRSGLAETDGCNIETEGVCSLTVCPLEGRPEPAVGPRVDAGAVAATFDTGEGLVSATVAYGEDSYPGTASNFVPSWFVSGRETGTISALGGSDVDAFEREFTVPLMLLMNNAIVGVAPERAIEVPKAGLELQWERGEEGVELYIESLVTPNDGVSSNFLRCTFDSVLGRGTIPASFAGRMLPGSTALLLTGRRTSFVQNDRDVSLRLYTATLAPERDAELSLVFVD